MTISTNTEALNATALATRAIHAGQEPDPTTGAVVTPIYMTSTFKQDGVGLGQQTVGAAVHVVAEQDVVAGLQSGAQQHVDGGKSGGEA